MITYRCKVPLCSYIFKQDPTESKNNVYAIFKKHIGEDHTTEQRLQALIFCNHIRHDEGLKIKYTCSVDPCRYSTKEISITSTEELDNAYLEILNHLVKDHSLDERVKALTEELSN